MPDEAPSLAREDLLRELPSTQRGLRTRGALVAAARTVFERKGYLDTRLADITAEAACSTGTFYTYFATKEEVFAALLAEAQEDMLHPGLPRVPADADPAAIVVASNEAYFLAYERNAKLMGLLEQVANIDPEFRKVRQRRAETFISRNARSIAYLQETGVVDPALDPKLASRALSAMVSRLAYLHFVVGPGDDDPPSLGELITIANQIWLNGLGMTTRLSGQTPADLDVRE